MSDQGPATATPTPTADEPQPHVSPPCRTSKIPPTYAEGVLRRHVELGWTLRDIAQWLTKTLGKTITYGTVARFIEAQQRKLAREAQQPFYDYMQQRVTVLNHELDVRNSMVDETGEELRVPGRPVEEVTVLTAEHSRLLREIRSLVSQVNACNRYVLKPPKADSPLVRVCTGGLDGFTETPPTEAEAAPAAEPAPATEAPPALPAEPYVPAQAIYNQRTFTWTTRPANDTTPVEPPTIPTDPIPVVLYAGGPARLAEWKKAFPVRIAADDCKEHSPDPGWEHEIDDTQIDVLFVDLTQGWNPLEWSNLLLDVYPDLELRTVYLVNDQTPAALLAELKQFRPPVNPVLKELTRESVCEAMYAVLKKAVDEGRLKPTG